MESIIGLSYQEGRRMLIENGFETEKETYLPALKLSVPLESNFYKNLGTFKDSKGLLSKINEFLLLNESSLNDGPDGKRIQGFDFNGGGLTVGMKQLDVYNTAIIAKGTIFTDNPCIRSYVEAHEEAHVVEMLNQTHLFENWLRERNLGHINLKEVIRMSESSGEHLATLISLATVCLDGISFDFLNRGSTNYAIERELMPLFQTY